MAFKDNNIKFEIFYSDNAAKSHPDTGGWYWHAGYAGGPETETGIGFGPFISDHAAYLDAHRKLFEIVFGP